VYETAGPERLLGALGELSSQGLFLLWDIAPHLQPPAMSRAFRDIAARFARPGTLSTMIVAGQAVDLPPEIEAVAVRFGIRPPEPGEYRQVVAAVCASLAAGGRATVEIGAGDYDDFARALRGMTLNQARQALAQAAFADGRLAPGDLARLGEIKAQALREDGLLEYFPPADNAYELGGFAGLRGWLERARVGFGDEARSLNLPPPRGILIVGVQGCGKSLSAKVIAREWELPLVKLDAGRLYDKFIGESERNFRRATALAESMAPVVLWIDEMEKGFAPSGGEDGGVSRRILGSFLTWLQEKRADVFVVATANDLSIVPPELLRKGRFDEIFFVDLPRADERRQILEIHLRLRRQEPAAFDLDALVEAADGFSGAEIEQAVISSLYGALHAERPLDTDAVLRELRATVPLSVSRREDIERLRATASERFVPVAGVSP
jgi:hypothetical protein